MDIQALGILSSITMQENVNVVRNTGNDFREVFEKITGGELAREIGNSYNVTLNVGSIVSCQQLLDEYDMRGTNHVIISPETLSKMESDPAMKKSVLSKIEEFCSSESPPVKSAGMIIYPDGSTLYWLEGYPNEIGNEKDKKIVNEMSISESFQKYSDTNYQATENNLESIMQIMATEYKRKSIS